MNQTPLFARQPIVDRQLNVQGYELLFRGARTDKGPLDGDQASSQVLMSAFANQNIHELLGGKPAYINCTRNFLQHAPDFLQPNLILEILETTRVDSELLSLLEGLKSKGYRIALDDFTPGSDHEALLPLADIVKLDLRALDMSSLKHQCQRLTELGICMLAEKVETKQEFEQCLAMGFSLFQGFFYSQPEIIAGQAINADSHLMLRLLSDLSNPEISVHQIHNMIAADPALSFKIMKLVNSTYFRRGKAIDSLQQAIVLLGLDNLRNMIGLLVMENAGMTNTMLQHMSLMRANFALMLAKRCFAEQAASAFTLGILSCLEHSLGQGAMQLLSGLNLRPEVADALLRHRGRFDSLMQLIQAHENLAEELPDPLLMQELGVSIEDISEAYILAIRITDLILFQMLEH